MHLDSHLPLIPYSEEFGIKPNHFIFRLGLSND